MLRRPWGQAPPGTEIKLHRSSNSKGVESNCEAVATGVWGQCPQEIKFKLHLSCESKVVARNCCAAWGQRMEIREDGPCTEKKSNVMHELRPTEDDSHAYKDHHMVVPGQWSLRACFLGLLLLGVVAAASHVNSPYHNVRADRACDTVLAANEPWSGFRITRTAILDWPLKQMLRLVYCRYGQEIAVADVPWESPVSGSWNMSAPFCFAQEGFDLTVDRCFVAILKRGVTFDTVGSLIQRPDLFVGGLFRCSGPVCDSRLPLLPLLTDEAHALWIERDSWPPSLHMPLLYTPGRLSLQYLSGDEWAAGIDS